jgi:16S rRNA (cytidine1402-2'-O)-methyltransferase
VTDTSGTLYLVPTPIGNPADITLRAIEVLRRVDVVASEDTRHARTLLKPLDIQTRLVSYHDHNEETRTPALVAELLAGADVALVSDAGTPLVNDPGYRLVTAAIAEGIRVCPLPGASSTITALIASGLPVHTFHYAGFLPRRSAARKAAVERLAGIEAALIFFEAPHRIVEMLEDVRAVLGDRQVALARNLTKHDETFLRGSLRDVTASLAAQDEVRGQFVIVVAGADAEVSGANEVLADRLTESLLRNGADTRLTREVVQEITGLSRNEVYRRVQQR